MFIYFDIVIIIVRLKNVRSYHSKLLRNLYQFIKTIIIIIITCSQFIVVADISEGEVFGLSNNYIKNKNNNYFFNVYRCRKYT